MFYNLSSLTGSKSKLPVRLFGGLCLALLVAMSFSMTACNDDDDSDTGDTGGGTGPTGPIYTADELNTMGWESFANADYGGARVSFEDALTIDSNHDEATLGLGWSLCYTGLNALAATTFDLLLDGGTYDTDSRAGKAAAVLSSDPQMAIDLVAEVLGYDSAYVFSRQENFDYLDLTLIKAQAFYALGDYASTRTAIAASGGADLSDTAESWTVDSVVYTDYQIALAMEIERLSVILSAEVVEG